jgi:hypothetical protein
MEKAKEEKLIEAQNLKRKDQLASLSLLRGSLLTYSGDKGQISYQNRLRKIAMLEKSLCKNPAFTEYSLVKTPIPFLYSKENDIVIRKGDILISDGKPYEVFSLNFKRREFHARPIWEGGIKNGSSDRNIVMSVNSFKEKRASAYIPQPCRDERKLLKTIHSGDFYSHANKELQEKYYPLHLLCATYNECLPPLFSIDNDGKLAVTEDRYYAYREADSIQSLNPFSSDGLKLILTAAQKGIETECKWHLETYCELFRLSIPELSEILFQAIGIEEELSESA